MDLKPDIQQRPRRHGQGFAPKAELWLIAFYLIAGLLFFVYAERALVGWLGAGGRGRSQDDSHELTAKGTAFVLAAGAVLFAVLRGTRSGRRVSRPLKHTEAERFEWVARASTDGMWDWDLRSNRVWRSEGYYTLLGCRAHDLGGSIEAWIDRLHPDDQERVVTDLRRAIRSGETRWTEDYQLRTQEGAHVRVVDRAVVLHDEQGGPVRVIGGLTRQPDR